MKMESSRLTKRLKAVTVKKDRLFYDQYLYCFNFRMQEVSVLREGLDHDAITRVLAYRESWNRSPNFGGSWRSRRGKEINDDVRKGCHALCDFLLAQSDYKLMLSMDWGYIYTNDLPMIESMQDLDYITPVGLKQVVVDRPRDTLIIQNSQHEMRSFFRSARLTQEQKDNLTQFLRNQDDVRMGPGLARFLKDEQKYRYINDNNFIDHNGTGILLMLNLILPRAIRKTVKLLKHK